MIELTRRNCQVSQDRFVGEFSLILASNAVVQGRAETTFAKREAVIPRVSCNHLILIEAPS